MKRERQQQVIEIVREHRIETQDALKEALREAGFDVTQATVSRDIKELQLVKVADEAGYRYAVTGQGSDPLSRQHRLLRDSSLEAEVAGQLVVLRTLSGAAPTAAEALDTLDWDDVVGTVAGDNTVLVVARNAAAAARVVARLRRIMD